MSRGRIRVVLLSETFSEGMGYLENFLPKYLGRLGVESHVVTTDLPANYRLHRFAETYGQFAKMLKPNTVQQHEDFTLHVLGHRKTAGHMRTVGLRQKLTSLRPDVVQTMSAVGWVPLDAALLQPLLGYRLFTGCHYHASVFSLASKRSSPFSRERLGCWMARTLPGRFVSLFSEKCYAIAPDCADIAVRFFGVPRGKVCMSSLGVDTEIFHPVANEAERSRRLELRQRLGYSESDIVCVYSGRFSEDKNPLLLGESVERLAQSGRSYRGLFIGNGEQASSIQARAGCQVHPFVAVHELGDFFRAADVGVWPTQESMSMLDASACGVPIIANDTMSVPERLNESGLSYRINDVDDLSRVLLQLEDLETRVRLGSFGARRIARDFSWETIARRRLADYETALGRPSTLRSRSKSNELLNSAD